MTVIMQMMPRSKQSAGLGSPALPWMLRAQVLCAALLTAMVVIGVGVFQDAEAQPPPSEAASSAAELERLHERLVSTWGIKVDWRDAERFYEKPFTSVSHEFFQLEAADATEAVRAFQAFVDVLRVFPVAFGRKHFGEHFFLCKTLSFQGRPVGFQNWLFSTYIVVNKQQTTQQLRDRWSDALAIELFARNKIDQDAWNAITPYAVRSLAGESPLEPLKDSVEQLQDLHKAGFLDSRGPLNLVGDVYAYTELFVSAPAKLIVLANQYPIIATKLRLFRQEFIALDPTMAEAFQRTGITAALDALQPAPPAVRRPSQGAVQEVAISSADLDRLYELLTSTWKVKVEWRNAEQFYQKPFTSVSPQFQLEAADPEQAARALQALIEVIRLFPADYGQHGFAGKFFLCKTLRFNGTQIGFQDWLFSSYIVVNQYQSNQQLRDRWSDALAIELFAHNKVDHEAWFKITPYAVTSLAGESPLEPLEDGVEQLQKLHKAGFLDSRGPLNLVGDVYAYTELFISAPAKLIVLANRYPLIAAKLRLFRQEFIALEPTMTEAFERTGITAALDALQPPPPPPPPQPALPRPPRPGRR